MDKTEAGKEQSMAEMAKCVAKIEHKGVDVADAENPLTPTAPGTSASFSLPVAIPMEMTEARKEKCTIEMEKKVVEIEEKGINVTKRPMEPQVELHLPWCRRSSQSRSPPSSQRRIPRRRRRRWRLKRRQAPMRPWR
jgi:hypothetical protein